MRQRTTAAKTALLLLLAASSAGAALVGTAPGAELDALQPQPSAPAPATKGVGLRVTGPAAAAATDAPALKEENNRRKWTGDVLESTMMATIRGYPCVLLLGPKGKTYGCSRLLPRHSTHTAAAAAEALHHQNTHT